MDGGRSRVPPLHTIPNPILINIFESGRDKRHSFDFITFPNIAFLSRTVSAASTQFLLPPSVGTAVTLGTRLAF